MNTAAGNIWSYVEKAVLVIPTNGYVTTNGRAVMGRGLALQVKNRFIRAPYQLGRFIHNNGHKVGLFYDAAPTTPYPKLCSFPVKPVEKYITDPSQLAPTTRCSFKLNTLVPGWACMADLNLIEMSAKQLAVLAEEQDWPLVVLPRVGCGNGGLVWNTFKPILDNYLDNERFLVVHQKD